MRIPAIILAAGGSRRLGRPKQLVVLDGETLLDRTIRVVREAGAGPIFVVLGAGYERIVAGARLVGVETVVNAEWELGIASSIHTGLRKLLDRLPNAGGVMMMVCDQPRATAEHLSLLMARFEAMKRERIVASSYAGIAGIPAIFPSEVFPALFALYGDSGARALLRDDEVLRDALPFAHGELDIDTPEDLARL